MSCQIGYVQPGATSKPQPPTPPSDGWIIIRTLIGKTFLWKFTNPNETIASIKFKIQYKEQIFPDEQRLMYKGKLLEDINTLSYYGIKANSTLILQFVSKNATQYFQVQNPSGKNIFCIWHDTKKVVTCKEEISQKELISIQEQIFNFNDNLLENQRKLTDYQITDGSLVHLLIQLKNGKIKILEHDLLDPYFDYDFTNVNDERIRFVRGGEIYERPCGWQRIALKVEGKFDDDQWLKSNGNPSEWASAYHGTNLDGLKGISLSGFDIDKLKRGLYGWGHYTTPFIEIAEEYATPIQVNGVKIKYIIQSRINPRKIIKKNDEKYWILPNNEDLRPYGICYKICPDDNENGPPPSPPPPPAAPFSSGEFYSQRKIFCIQEADLRLSIKNEIIS